ncbi:hypothetical protein Taro_053053 [Colocasia esculenta]|uniref:Exocyst subunit Exo70 family protein n=1 Tax=Colocasia esculenta TaxID=4460 RepID=A0A843XK70_COLES|nr:hypothetical protein [Colocasia esculenta]
MDGSDGGGTPSPAASPMTADDVEAAEKLIMCWDSAASEESAARMLFDGGDRAEADRYLRAVDEIRRSLRDPAGGTGSPRRLTSGGAIQAAMARLEDEFRNILVSRVNAVEIEALASDLSFASLSSADFSAVDVGGGEDSCRGDYKDEADEDAADGSSRGGGGGSISRTITASSNQSYRSASSIREIDLVPADAVDDLRSIAERMVASGYGRECVQVYGSVRKAAVDHSLRQLGVEKLSIGDVQRLEWEALETKIRRWIRAARTCVRVVFASERRLCEQIFDGLLGGVGVGGGGDDAPFLETVKGAAIQLLGFAEAISIGRRSPEKLFKILDLHDALADLLPDVADVFLRYRPTDPIHTQATEIVSRLAEAARGILSEFESAVLRDPSKIPVPGGTIHPLTRYVMNYISLISDYKPTLTELIVAKPAAPTSPRFGASPGDDDSAFPSLEMELPESEDQSPLAAHLIWIIVILQSNLENKAKLYKDVALSHLFLMNNVHYIVHKVKGNPELREMIGDDYLKKMTGKFRQAATSYQRSAWARVLHCLRDEGLHVSGGFSSGISKSSLRERFRAFNLVFDEVHRTQSLWLVPDGQLREELRISISELLLPAYRSFLGRFRHHIESGRHPEMYIKYSVEDLETALSDFFEGAPPSLPYRRRSH